jgi:hypothetical protein
MQTSNLDFRLKPDVKRQKFVSIYRITTMNRKLIILLGLVPLLAACISSTEEMNEDEVQAGHTPTGQVEETVQSVNVEPIDEPVVEAYPPPLSTDHDVESEPGGRRAEFPNTIIVYQRGRKTLGRTAQWTVYPTGRVVSGEGTEWQVFDDEIKPLFEAVEAETFWQLSEAYAPSGGCEDCLLQTVTVFYQGMTKEIVVTQADLELPENLKLVLDVLEGIVTQE